MRGLVLTSLMRSNNRSLRTTIMQNVRVRTISESKQGVRTSIESPANPLGSAVETVGEIAVSTFIWMKVPPDVNKLVRFRVFWGCKEILESCCLDLGVARCLIPIRLRVREV